MLLHRPEYRSIPRRRGSAVRSVTRSSWEILHAMSQSDIDALRARYEAVSRGDRAAIYRDVQPGFTLKTPDRVPNAGTYHGSQEAIRFVEDFWGPFEEVIIEPEEFRENGDQIVVFVRGRLRHKGSSAFVDIRVANIWTMRDGKPIRCEWFPERQKALAAAGLSE
jgi:ketosteroid isomerase-like protein